MSATLILTLITVGLSIWAWQDSSKMARWIFNPYAVDGKNEYHRFLTSGFIHRDYLHLIFNMFVFYMFGTIVEQIFKRQFGAGTGTFLFITMYILGIIIADIPTYFKYRKSPYYNALGASGGVSSILFSFIIFLPLEKLCLYGISFLCFPGIVWGVLYLIYTVMMGRKKVDNINHDAHLYGALFGIIFTIIFIPGSLTSFFAQLADFQLF